MGRRPFDCISPVIVGRRRDQDRSLLRIRISRCGSRVVYSPRKKIKCEQSEAPNTYPLSLGLLTHPARQPCVGVSDLDVR